MALCYLSLHRMKQCIQWIDQVGFLSPFSNQLQMLDPSCQYQSFYILAAYLAQMNHIPYTQSSFTLTSTEQAEWIQQACIHHPFHITTLLLDCYDCHNQDLRVVEQKYWNLVNYYPSYSSYLRIHIAVIITSPFTVLFE